MKLGIADTVWRWRHQMGKGSEKGLGDFRVEAAVEDLDMSDFQGGDEDDIKGTEGSPPPKAPGLGTSVTVKTYYQAPDSSTNNPNWVDYPPRQLPKSAAKVSDRVALKLFKAIDANKPCINGRPSLKYHSLIIQNPDLVAAIAPILRDEGRHLDVGEPAKFNEPFQHLFFGAAAISAHYRKLPESDPVRPYLLLLIRVLDELFGDVRAKRRSLQASGLVSFDGAWTFFPRRAAVLSRGTTFEHLGEVVETAYKHEEDFGYNLVITTKVLRFNSEAYVWENETLRIRKFDNYMPIRDLEHLPLEFHEDPIAVKGRMAERGRRTLEYQGLRYCKYKGVATYQAHEKHNVRGTLMLQSYQAN
jgi:hypothetical protein